ncbi:hypothetical protein SSS_10529, partial [Sarcoptes scabiei]
SKHIFDVLSSNQITKKYQSRGRFVFHYQTKRTDRVEAKRIKMLRQLLLLCLVAIVIDQALIVSAKSKNLKHPHHPHCPPHSHWDPCSPGCEHSCATLDKDLVCTKECGPGCACDDGYVRRNSDGTGPCVRRRHCKRPHHRKCPKHSHWAPCGLSCPKTCAHPYGPFRCPLVCKPGCKCDKDYVRRNSDGTGPCVRRRHCKDLTTENALNILIGLLVVFHARKHVHILMVH